MKMLFQLNHILSALKISAITFCAMLIGCSLENQKHPEATEIVNPYEIAGQREYDHVWSEEEKAIIQAMYASTQYSATTWQQIAYSMLKTNEASNAITQHFPCSNGCEIALVSSMDFLANKIIVKTNNYTYYDLESRRELPPQSFQGESLISLPVAEFPRKATIGKRCSDDTEASCYQAFSDQNGKFVAMQEDYPNASYLTQQTPFDFWKPNK